MFNYNYILIAVLIIILIYYIYLYEQWYSSSICGMWEATEEFCTKSELEGMHLMIGEPSRGKHKSCIIMTSDNQVALDETFDLRFSWSLPSVTHGLTIWLDLESDLIPNKLECDIDFASGKMVWYDSKDRTKEYANFRKLFIN